MPTVEFEFNGLIVEWESDKAALVAKEHGVTFTEALTVFDDVLALTDVDDRDYDSEERYITIGMSNKHRLLTVVWIARSTHYRLITTFKANTHNQRRYNNARR